MAISTKHRTQEAEIMDDFSLHGEELRDALDKLAGINAFLGGNSVVLQGIRKLIKNIDSNREIVIADIGCGNGDMLRVIADYGKKNNINFKLTGIDANEFTITYARKLSVNYSNIDYTCIDIFKPEFERISYDILICTLTLHHFKDDEILKIMPVFINNAQAGVIINDLHRSSTAYHLFKVVCAVFGLNRMSREDGLISILRGFKKNELRAYSEKLNLKKYTLQWKWAFRYQWIIYKT